MSCLVSRPALQRPPPPPPGSGAGAGAFNDTVPCCCAGSRPPRLITLARWISALGKRQGHKDTPGQANQPPYSYGLFASAIWTESVPTARVPINPSVINQSIPMPCDARKAQARPAALQRSSIQVIRYGHGPQATPRARYLVSLQSTDLQHVYSDSSKSRYLLGGGVVNHLTGPIQPIVSLCLAVYHVSPASPFPSSEDWAFQSAVSSRPASHIMGGWKVGACRFRRAAGHQPAISSTVGRRTSREAVAGWWGVGTGHTHSHSQPR